MKYYVVSETELDELYYADRYERQQADEACRTRPVPEWATHFTGDLHEQGYVEGWEFEEIKK